MQQRVPVLQTAAVGRRGGGNVRGNARGGNARGGHVRGGHVRGGPSLAAIGVVETVLFLVVLHVLEGRGVQQAGLFHGGFQCRGGQWRGAYAGTQCYDGVDVVGGVERAIPRHMSIYIKE
jgi:hypothetical protein